MSNRQNISAEDPKKTDSSDWKGPGKRLISFFTGNQIFKTRESKTHVRNSTGRVAFAAIAILVQVYWLVVEATRLNAAVPLIESLTRVLAFILVLWIYSQNKTPSMKMPWIILLLFSPVLGIILYLLVGLSGSTKRMRERYKRIDAQLMPLLHRDSTVCDRMKEKDAVLANISHYLDTMGFPAYDNSCITYFNTAEEGLEAQKEAMRHARRFIFMEYHAIEDAESWAGICEILAAKAAEGVTVRVFYDDAGSTTFISRDFVEKMHSLGIDCRVFNPIGPVLNIFLNNRDHRKITVVDGTIGFTGGYNLANEYFNITHPYGHWKDTGIRITGEAVQTLTVLFLEMWNAISGRDLDDVHFDGYLPYTSKQLPGDNKADVETNAESNVVSDEYTKAEGGFVQPYADSPIDNVQVGEDLYLHIINGARSYVWFMTPYLIITDEMTRAFILAAKRGVDVRIITPGIPDKKTVYSVTRSYYPSLLKNGVKIYEYTPGFCHAKMCIVDDLLATCGTINLDYRSLYHHFENGCLFACCEAVLDVRRDFEETFTKCRSAKEYYDQRITWDEVHRLERIARDTALSKEQQLAARTERNRGWQEKTRDVRSAAWQSVLRLFAELM